ncbi:MAG: hypothetical protein R3A52_16900 [Polyangiales bacterium]
MRKTLLTLATGLLLSLSADATPQVGRAMPRFAVNDLNGARRTDQDLRGHWSIVFAMTDKDTGPALRAWWQRVERSAPPGTQMYTFAALDLFGMIPTSTVVSQARDSAPRSRWNRVFLSRDGSLAEQLGLPESETPWVFVVAPDGRVVESIHAPVNEAHAQRVLDALAPAVADRRP